MEKSLFRPFVTITVLMGITLYALTSAVGVEFNKIPGVVMDFPEKVGIWVGNELRFCHNSDACAKDYRDASFYIRDLDFPDICPNCGAGLFKCARAEKEQLPPDTEFVKSAFTNAVGTRLHTSIVLSGTARDSIHRPQRCLKGQGNTLESEYTLEVPLAGRNALDVRVIKTSRTFRTAEGDIPYYGFYAYWFVGKKRETSSHYARMFWLAWDRVVNSEANRWAYIAVSGQREPDSDEYEEHIISFVQQVYPKVLSDAFHEHSVADR